MSSSVSQTDARPQEADHRPGVVLAVCCIALFMVSLDNTVVNVALPTIEQAFKASQSDLQWIVDGYVLVLGSLLLSSGALGDRIGRRRVFRIGLVIFCASSLACSLAPDLPALVAAACSRGSVARCSRPPRCRS